MKNQLFNAAFGTAHAALATAAVSGDVKPMRFVSTSRASVLEAGNYGRILGFAAPACVDAPASAKAAAKADTATAAAAAPSAPIGSATAADVVAGVAQAWTTPSAAPAARHRRARVVSVIEDRYREKSR